MTTRREFVAVMLGSAIAAACRGRGQRVIPPGTIVGTGMERAHQLVRDGAPISPTIERRHRVVIVGAGASGLAAAWELRRRGIQDIVVLELDDRIGGTARGGQSSVTGYPWGAHYIVAPQPEQTELIALLTEMGAIESVAADGTPIVDEALRCREPEERVFYRGRWYEGLFLDAGASADDRAQLQRFRKEIDRWVTWRDRENRRAFTIPRSRASTDPAPLALDRQSFASWLDALGVTSPRVRWLADYACRDDFALTAQTTSAWAGVCYFASRQRHAGSDAEPVVTWPDGNASLIRQLANGQTIERGVAVVEIDGDRVVCRSDREAFVIRAERIIVATPTFVANRIVKARRGQTAGDYGAWAVANLHLRDRPRPGRGAPPAWDNVLHASLSLGYVTATHQRGRDRGPTVWTWYYPFTDDDAPAVRAKLAGAGYEEWAEVVLADLEVAHPDLREQVERIEVGFWGHGMIRPRPGVLWGNAREVRMAPIGTTHFAHTDLSGFALFEEALDHGVRAAREVAGALA
ncbi:MAG: FAD-dependent oxidoreductase [Kofleriaceae bacterium]